MAPAPIPSPEEIDFLERERAGFSTAAQLLAIISNRSFMIIGASPPPPPERCRAREGRKSLSNGLCLLCHGAPSLPGFNLVFSLLPSIHEGGMFALRVDPEDAP